MEHLDQSTPALEPTSNMMLQALYTLPTPMLAWMQIEGYKIRLLWQHKPVWEFVFYDVLAKLFWLALCCLGVSMVATFLTTLPSPTLAKFCATVGFTSLAVTGLTFLAILLFAPKERENGEVWPSQTMVEWSPLWIGHYSTSTIPRDILNIATGLQQQFGDRIELRIEELQILRPQEGWHPLDADRLLTAKLPDGSKHYLARFRPLP